MDIGQLLRGRQCECGKFHSCDIEYCYIEKNACDRLTGLCKDYKSILIVADENTFKASGSQTINAVKKPYKTLVFSGKTLLIPNEEAIQKVSENLDGVDLIIGIGSGVMQDLCKYVAHKNNLPYFIVATAPSMDGYASTGAAMILNGMKETCSAKVPKAIIADTLVLANAPEQMIKAGYGDIVGKFSALNDWKLAKAVNNEYFCQFIYDLTMDMVNKTLSLAGGLLKKDEQSVKTLMEALVIVGIAMSFAGSSRPASGSEHHLSHFFEITGIVFNQEYFCHGLDVAYSTVITSKIREQILNGEFAKEQYLPKEQDLKKDLAKVYGSVGEGCYKLQEKLGTYKQNRAQIYLYKEQEIRQILSECPTADQIETMLNAVDIDMQDFYALYGEQKINDAVRFAKDLKDRYTVLWLNYDMNGGERL